MKASNKDNLIEIKNNFKRFVSLMLIAFLGVGFFVGIRSSSPSILKSVDEFYDMTNFYDISVASNLGLTDLDLEDIEKLDHVQDAKPIYYHDTTTKINDKIYTIKIMTFSSISMPYLIEGNFPQKDEILIEDTYLKDNNLQIGDKISIDQVYQKNDDGEDTKFFTTTEFTIVGTCISPLYLEINKGNTSYGNGTLNYIGYISDENITNKNIITQIDIKVDGTNEELTNSKKYKDKVKIVTDELEQIRPSLETRRYNNLCEISTKKVDEAQKELEDKETQLQDTIKKYQSEINDGKEKINSNTAKLNSEKEKAKIQFADSQKQIDDGYAKLKNSETELSSKETQAYENIDNLNNTINELKQKKEPLIKNKNNVKDAIDKINTALLALNLKQNEKDNLLKEKKELENKLVQIEDGINQIDENILKIENTIENIKSEIVNAKTQINDSKIRLENSQNELNKAIKNANSEFDSSYIKLQNAKIEIENSQKELDEKKADYEKQINDAKNKLIDAREKIGDIKKGKVYIIDRNSNTSYLSLMQDIESVEKISYVFPLMFFFVAILISLNSMTRMIDEQRVTIGTYKALGYSKFKISIKYIIYCLIATIIGGTIGSIIGTLLIPKIIWKMYSIMYRLPNFKVYFNILIILSGLFILIFCIVGACIYSLITSLKENPAQLLRPKAPKIGKRVILENIKPLWNLFSFNQKVTIRNLFRYKKRVVMTIFGIAGTTTLILTGFGLKDSISNLITNQYGRVFKYDMQVVLKDAIDENDYKNIIQKLQNIDEIENEYGAKIISSKIKYNSKEEDVHIIVVPDLDNLDNIFNLYNGSESSKIQLNNDGIVITDKVAKLLNIKQNDTIELNVDNEIKELKVENICNNYISHYVYMTKELYEKTFGTYKPNIVFINLKQELNEEKENDLSSLLLSIPGISTVNYNRQTLENLEMTLSSLNIVVLVLIISAGLLSFVVLYNLASINISERKREIATIKVLGMYDKEVFRYITDETIILSVIGISIGLVCGYFMSYYILKTCEINSLVFERAIKISSFIISAIISVVFTLIVNIMTYFSLKKVDMIDSLKSVE